LLLDYKQFLAARSIQRKWRKFKFWRDLDRRTRAATTIQKWWRGYSVRSKHYQFVEDMLQQRLENHYYKSANKIQALFRGYQVRNQVHDNGLLRRMQVCAAEDLLNCVAFKLHHLLRTYTIPGVYSLKNSTCLSRVEKLMTSLHFRYFNGKVVSQKALTSAQVQKGQKAFKKSGHYTKIPFPSPNYWSKCSPQCEASLKMCKDMDKRMYKIIEMYDASQKEAQAALMQKNLAHKKQKKLMRKIQMSLEQNKRDFCGDVIASMRRWNFLDGNKSMVDINIFRNPEKLSLFLNEISDLVQEFENCTCYCRMPVFDKLFCH
ncbi:hypothetical protein KR009_009540, partial [Drosophila setifemur]